MPWQKLPTAERWCEEPERSFLLSPALILQKRSWDLEAQPDGIPTKWKKFQTVLSEVDGCSIKIPEHSRLALVCSLKEYHETGDHYLYICNVEQVYGNPEEKALFAWKGYSQLRSAE